MKAYVRLGGIAAFVAVIAFGSAMGLHFAKMPGKAPEVIALLSLAVCFAAIAIAFWGTKTFFNAHDYRRADLAVSAFAGLFIVLSVAVLIERAGLVLNPAGIAGRIIDIALLTASLALSALFGLQSIGFASAGGRIWKAIGILYLVGSIALAVAIAADFADLAEVSPVLKGILSANAALFMLALIASVIVHGIALTVGASKMRAATAA